MRRSVWTPFILLLLPCLASPAESAAFQAPAPTVSAVETLRLDGSIRSWGRLGGMAIDRLGFLYVSSFGESVWRITPDGAVTELANDLYGASGMVIGPDGALYQAEFFTNSIRRIARDGSSDVWATGLNGPVGVVAAPDGTLFVVNCNGNSVARVGPDGVVSTLVQSNELFSCPNGIALTPEALFVVSFGNNNLVRVEFDGTAELFATIGEATPPAAGHAHIAAVGGYFFVTTIKTGSLWRVGPEGAVTRLIGPNNPEMADGPRTEARLANPNAIVAAPGPMGPLFLNTIEPGQWGTTAPTELFIRRVLLQPEGG